MNSNPTPDVQAQLDLLRDISLPEAVSWWPLAPGWWLAAGTVVTLLTGALVYLYFHRRSLRYIALQELTLLRQQAGDMHSVELATRLSVLLHRVAVAGGNRASGKLSNAQWSEYLSQGKGGMAPDIAEFIASAPYREQVHFPANTEMPEHSSLLDKSEHWIRRHT
ncbi:DUF4381 domain-containing protein [Aliamphritea spongicola]|uniref:DUF4381 domain-containing protein n=1 Tax=Aliamphritea spongicola TaxID=707589 RepID=UPI00196AC131|nr:DUF4381 domain-containing protein [Aliamphritea spongicola]MBN3561607.1 DUF4381 domain-containing protein [Aliamphritea spongicola]